MIESRDQQKIVQISFDIYGMVLFKREQRENALVNFCTGLISKKTIQIFAICLFSIPL